MSSNSITFWLHNTNKNCSNFLQVAPANASYSSQFTYHTWRQDADAEYLVGVRMVLCSHVGSMNFADPTSIRQVHKPLMNEVRNEATNISNK